jgi:hypothetical protein
LKEARIRLKIIHVDDILKKSDILKIIEILENIEANTRRLLILAELDAEDVAEGAEGGDEDLLGEALDRLEASPADVHVNVVDVEDPEASRRVGVF